MKFKRKDHSAELGHQRAMLGFYMIALVVITIYTYTI